MRFIDGLWHRPNGSTWAPSLFSLALLGSPLVRKPPFLLPLKPRFLLALKPCLLLALKPRFLLALKPRFLLALKPRFLLALKPRFLLALKPRFLLALKPRFLLVLFDFPLFTRRHGAVGHSELPRQLLQLIRCAIALRPLFLLTPLLCFLLTPGWQGIEGGPLGVIGGERGLIQESRHLPGRMPFLPAAPPDICLSRDDALLRRLGEGRERKRPMALSVEQNEPALSRNSSAIVGAWFQTVQFPVLGGQIGANILGPLGR